MISRSRTMAYSGARKFDVLRDTRKEEKRLRADQGDAQPPAGTDDLAEDPFAGYQTPFDTMSTVTVDNDVSMGTFIRDEKYGGIVWDAKSKKFRDSLGRFVSNESVAEAFNQSARSTMKNEELSIVKEEFDGTPQTV